MQFVMLFSLVIAIVLFGVLKILDGKELAALLGGFCRAISLAGVRNVLHRRPIIIQPKTIPRSVSMLTPASTETGAHSLPEIFSDLPVTSRHGYPRCGT